MPHDMFQWDALAEGPGSPSPPKGMESQGRGYVQSMRCFFKMLTSNRICQGGQTFDGLYGKQGIIGISWNGCYHEVDGLDGTKGGVPQGREGDSNSGLAVLNGFRPFQ